LTSRLEDVQIKLAALWVTVMFLFVYVDLYTLYAPGHLEGIIAGDAAGFQITQAWLLGIMALMTIPSLMIFLSLILPAKVNRWVNIIVGIIWIVIVIGSLFVGEALAYYLLASIVQAVVLSLIIWHAWTWPTHEG